MAARLIEAPELHDRAPVFRDRAHAGEVLAALLAAEAAGDVAGAVVLAIPAGGVPVAAALARDLALPLELAVVSKVTLPWNSEAGFGAVAFDGTTRLNERLVERLGLREATIEDRLAQTRQKVARRVAELCGGRAPAVRGRTVVVVDDGLASGFTLRVALLAVRKAGAARVVAAVPTGSAGAVAQLAGEVDLVACANVRGGATFAVADAYVDWHDVDDDELRRALAAHC